MRKFVIPAKVSQVTLPVPEKAAGGTPDHIRQAKSKRALLYAGGSRVSINLPAGAVDDMEAIKARDGCDNTRAIVAALRRLAGSRP